MKQILAIIALSLALIAGAKNLSKEQLQFRLDIVKDLTAEGLQPKIDSDGDIEFTKNGINYYVIINENWHDPFIYTIYARFEYSGSYNKEVMQTFISQINNYKVVKLHCTDYGYTLRADVLCQDAKIFRPTFNSIISQNEEVISELSGIINSGLDGNDLMGSDDEILARAQIYLLQDEYNKAFQLLNRLAEKGYSDAYSFMGLCYQYGLGTGKDERLMRKYYEKAIDNGETWVAYRMGDYYDAKQDYDKALEMYTLCSGSENSNRSEAYYMMGKYNENGYGTLINLSKAIQCYKKSVQYSNELECDARLALIRLGQPVENRSEFVDISKSLLSGLTGKQMFEKGNEYEHGLNNRSVSLPKAYGYYKAAADHDYLPAYAKMGEIYVSDFYPFKDKTKSDKYYEKAFKAYKQRAGYDAEAAYQMGMFYRYGLGVAKDKGQAVNYFRSAAQRGSDNGNYELGLIYLEEMEPVDAFDCFMKAAEKGHGAAMFEVAKAYETGNGASRNRVQAKEWYSKCSETNSSKAKEASAALNRMNQN